MRTRSRTSHQRPWGAVVESEIDGTGESCRSVEGVLEHSTQIKALIFDLDGTLVDREETMRLFLVQQYHRFRRSAELFRA